MYDEWLARIICYAFSVPASPFVSQVNRATSETLRLQATQEGLVPLKAWIKNALDHVIQSCMNEPGLEFVWVGDDAIDPLQQAQTLQILVSTGIKTREEARAELGLGAGGKVGAPTPLGKFNPHHDEQGRFTTADNVAGPVGSPARKPRPLSVRVASNDAVMSDASGANAESDVAQIIEPEPLPPEPAGGARPAESAPATPSESLVEVIAPNGELPGAAAKLGNPRTMSASEDPDATAREYAEQLYDEKTATHVETDLDALGGFVVQRPDGAFIAYRPAGLASKDTLPTTATVEINDPIINRLNSGKVLKLKFPKK